MCAAAASFQRHLMILSVLSVETCFLVQSAFHRITWKLVLLLPKTGQLLCLWRLPVLSYVCNFDVGWPRTPA